MPSTKVVDMIPRVPKPQRIVIPATQQTSMVDMMGAPSLYMNHQMPTTFKPSYQTNMKTMYTAPVTTFHPKGNVQMVTTLYPANFPPPTSGQMMMTNYFTTKNYPRTPMQAISTFHPKPGAIAMTAAYHPKMNYDPNLNFYSPKTTVQTISSIHRPKANLQQNIENNAIQNGYIPKYHPRMETKSITHKLAPESTEASKFSYMTMPPGHTNIMRLTAPTTIDNKMQTVTPTLRPNVKNLLATIGLEPDSNALEINSQMSDLQQSSSSLEEVVAKTTTPSIFSTATSQTSTTSTMKPVLTPELKELLASFGLLPNAEQPAGQIVDPIRDELPRPSSSSLKDETLSVREFKPLPKSVTASDIEEKIDSSFEVKTNDFTAFKPLPNKESTPTKDEELDDLLKSYGILKDNLVSKTSNLDDLSDSDSQESESEVISATEKAPTMSRVPDVDIGFLTPDLTKVLGNIGINNVNKNKIDASKEKNSRRFDKSKATTTAYTSTIGTVASSTMENDYHKLHLLLDTIRELDNLTANLTDDELEKLNLRNFNLSQDTLTESTGPDPTYAMENTASPVKNEVKREIKPSEPTRIQLDIGGTTTASDDLSLDDEKLDTITTTETSTTGATSTSFTTAAADDDETLARKAKQENLDTNVSASEKETEKSTDLEDPTTKGVETSNGSISDLAGSFGGNDGLDPVSEEPLPPPRKNGFYFFADWNSFLEVGLDDSDKVIVKFDPKVGSNAQFVPVKIP